MQQKNFLLFVVLSIVILFGWTAVTRYVWPPPQPKQESAEVADKDDANKAKNDDDKKKAENGKIGPKKPADKKPDDKKPEKPVLADLHQLPPTPANKLVALGTKEGKSKFHLFVELDPRGGGVRSLWFNKFQAADYLGRPEWNNAEKTEPMPLELISAFHNARSPSFQLFAFDVNAPTDDQPLDTLSRIDWTMFDRKSDEVDGRQRESVSFRAETQGVIVTKTYTLTEGEYHLGLAVKMRRKEGTDGNLLFRYQMTGGHGLPVEGKWYTSIFQNALMARVDKNGSVVRDLQTLQQISHWGGGTEFPRTETESLVYAGVGNQFFSSVIVVDNQQTNRGFLRKARPTLEAALTKGMIVSIDEERTSFVLKTDRGVEQTFYLPKGKTVDFDKGARKAVLHHTASAAGRSGEYAEYATNFFPEESIPALWIDDMTMRVTTEPVELKGDSEVVHQYLLYNGPVKVSQLFPPLGLAAKPLEEGGVHPDLFDRYHDELHLNTLTDYHTPGAMGRFANAIYFSAVIIKCTNVMHAVLGYIHAVIPSYGLCILVLTILVRGIMFPLSRKQALMSVRMQELAPELKKLQEKHKDDRQGMQMAQMELYRRHGVNPLGSCWVVMLQMPIFMGLYFALQESIHFRLAEFWPTWINNLAAPDMLFSWSQQIPYVSKIEDYGSFFYLGPYFNLLPVIAVSLMIVQQKLMTPPPADEQQAMQQKMMKYMMIFFGLMFYKVAAGLCLYFIASSAWGFCERKLLPKKKAHPNVIDPSSPPSESYLQKLMRKAQGDQVTTAPATGVKTLNGGIGGKRGRNKRRQGMPSEPETESNDTSMLGRFRKRIRDWWIAVLKEAEKKNRG